MPLTAQEFAEMRNLWNSLKETYDTLDGEVKAFKAESAETKTKWQRMEMKMQQLEQKALIPNPVAAGIGGYGNEGLWGTGREYMERKTAFLNFCRVGYERLPQEQKSLVPRASYADAPPIPGLEIKGLTIADDASGGFFAPPELDATIIKGF